MYYRLRPKRLYLFFGCINNFFLGKSAWIFFTLSHDIFLFWILIYSVLVIHIDHVIRAWSIETAYHWTWGWECRRGGKGKRPDIMFIAKHMDRIYELVFAECSRIICSDVMIKWNCGGNLTMPYIGQIEDVNWKKKMSLAFLDSRLRDKNSIYMFLFVIKKILAVFFF